MSPESLGFEHYLPMRIGELRFLYVTLQNLEEKVTNGTIFLDDVRVLFPGMEQSSEQDVLLRFGELLADSRQDCHILVLELLVRYGHAHIAVCGWLEELKKGHLAAHEHQSLYADDQRKNLISGVRALRVYITVCIEGLIPTSTEVLYSDVVKN
jgi:hypothetical protein